jgi:hypothetical protein
MTLLDNIIRLAYSEPEARHDLRCYIRRICGTEGYGKKASGLSTLDVRIFDFVRNQFLKELTDSFVETLTIRRRSRSERTGL